MTQIIDYITGFNTELSPNRSVLARIEIPGKWGRGRGGRGGREKEDERRDEGNCSLGREGEVR